MGAKQRHFSEMSETVFTHLLDDRHGGSFVSSHYIRIWIFDSALLHINQVHTK
jgi:hypothetical protein